MSEPLNILIAAPNAELYYAFEEAFLEFETELTYVTSYCDAIEALQKLPWRGNIRELSNMVERLVILCGNTITKEDVARYANS